MLILLHVTSPLAWLAWTASSKVLVPAGLFKARDNSADKLYGHNNHDLTKTLFVPDPLHPWGWTTLISNHLFPTQMLAPGRIHSRQEPTPTLSLALAARPPGGPPPCWQDREKTPRELFSGLFSRESLQEVALGSPGFPSGTTEAEIQTPAEALPVPSQRLQA